MHPDQEIDISVLLLLFTHQSLPLQCRLEDGRVCPNGNTVARLTLALKHLTGSALQELLGKVRDESTVGTRVGVCVVCLVRFLITYDPTVVHAPLFHFGDREGTKE